MSWIFSRKPRHETPTNLDKCLNCGHDLNPNDNYCPSCGQKAHSSKISLVELIKDFGESTLNINSSFVKSLQFILVPARIPREFIEGKRKVFLNPIRLFFVSFFGFVAAVSLTIDYDKIKIDNSQDLIIAQHKLSARLDTLAAKEGGAISQAQVDSIKRKILTEHYDAKHDTLSKNIYNTIKIGRSTIDYGISNLDAQLLTASEIIEKYNVTNFQHKILFTQLYRAKKNPSGLAKYLIGNSLWCIFLTIVLTSLFLKLLHIRHNRYIVEHNLLLFHTHAGFFIIATITLGVNYFLPEGFKAYWMISLALMLLPLLNFKYYYRQGWIKTIVKYFITGFMYYTFLTFMILVIAVISFALYR